MWSQWNARMSTPEEKCIGAAVWCCAAIFLTLEQHLDICCCYTSARG
jgi:hypothetical protein